MNEYNDNPKNKYKLIISILVAIALILVLFIILIIFTTSLKNILFTKRVVERETTETTTMEEIIEKTTEEITKELTEESTEETPSEETKETEEENVEDSVELIGTRTSPAGIRKVFKITKDDWRIGLVDLEIELTEVIYGSEAWNVIKNANKYNVEPGEGKEYILAKFRIKVIKTEEDDPFEAKPALFSAVSGGGVEYDSVSVTGLEPDIRTDLYEGAEHEGWTYFLVDIDDENPMAVFDRKEESEIWFKLRK